MSQKAFVVLMERYNWLPMMSLMYFIVILISLSSRKIADLNHCLGRPRELGCPSPVLILVAHLLFNIRRITQSPKKKNFLCKIKITLYF
jgi:hypothetical protein